MASNKPDAMALERAADAGIETAVFERCDLRRPRRRATARSATGSRSAAPGLIVLAGYMELLSAPVRGALSRPDRQRPPRAAAVVSRVSTRSARRSTHGVKVTGVTVHFVDEGVDSGPIILQRAVAVPEDRDRDALEDGDPPRRARAPARGDPPDRRREGQFRRRPPARCAHARDWPRLESAAGADGHGVTANRGRGRGRSRSGRRAAPRAQGADLGLRQDRRRRLRRRPRHARGSRSSRPAGPPTRCARRGSRCARVEELTGSPEILDGRVKTLHPKLHAALLAVRDDPAHLETRSRRRGSRRSTSSA